MYRKGAAGALLDIYMQAIINFKKEIEDIDDDALTIIFDKETADENCRCIQGILTHVVHAGFGYASSIQNLKVFKAQRPDKIYHTTISAYLQQLDEVFAFTENVFSEIQDNELECFDNALKIKTAWGQLYDVEQMMEHAIVHLLRHQRQIEKIKQSNFS